VRWELYPGMAFLKGVDAAGNACPSLHVATAVYSAFRLNWLLPTLGFRRSACWINALWCVAIAYSTVATRQHVVIDVIAGAALGAVFALLSRKQLRRAAMLHWAR
jgi:membrane-associated phospholipid phosphatase